MRRRNTIKNAIIKTITTIAVIVALLDACCLDSNSWIPIVVLWICIVWICLVAVANFPKG